MSIQAHLDSFFYLRKRTACSLTWLSMRLCGFEVTYSHCNNGKYETPKHKDLNLANATSVDEMLAQSKSSLTDEIDRRNSVIDKSKTLMTLGSLLLGFSGFFLVDSVRSGSTTARILVFVAAILLVNAIALIIEFFDIGKGALPIITEDEVLLDQNTLKKRLVNSYRSCATNHEQRTNYLVDVYRTAKFFFTCSLIVVVILFAVNFGDARSAKDDFIRELRSDPEILKMLRGPQGERGAPGRVGARGERGQRGLLGRFGTVDEQKIVDRVLKKLGEKKGK